LSNVDLTIVAGDTVYARCFQAEVILDGMKPGERRERRAYSFDVMFGQNVANAGEGRSNKWKKGPPMLGAF